MEEQKEFNEEVKTFMGEQKEFNKKVGQRLTSLESKVDAILECPTIKKEIKL